MMHVRNCPVAVVGGAGFLGSHLVDYLVEERSCGVLVLDNLCAGRREFINKKAKFVHCDITKSEGFLYRVFKDSQIQFVFNYAAWPYIPDSFARPLHVFDVNATGAMHVINAAHEAGAQAILQVSSAEIYGEFYGDETASKEFCNPKMREDAPVRPHSTYGVAKAAIDYYVQARWREAKVPCIAMRQFNCVGERETHPYVVPEIISQLHEVIRTSRPGDLPYPVVVKLGNNSFRDFQYAGDAVRMAVELLERGQWGDVYNMGSETGVKIYDLAKVIGKVMGFDEVQVIQDPNRVRPWEIWHLQSDNTKLYSVIATRPHVDLYQALEKTVAWYRSNGNKWAWEK